MTSLRSGCVLTPIAPLAIRLGCNINTTGTPSASGVDRPLNLPGSLSDCGRLAVHAERRRARRNGSPEKSLRVTARGRRRTAAGGDRRCLSASPEREVRARVRGVPVMAGGRSTAVTRGSLRASRFGEAAGSAATNPAGQLEEPFNTSPPLGRYALSNPTTSPRRQGVRAPRPGSTRCRVPVCPSPG
jgi:hypothetical protein